MRTKILSFIAISCLLILTSCGYDNYDEPKSIFSGKVVYEGETIGVRTNAVRLALFQDGYAFKSEIPAHIAQDGSFSVSLFNGEYKLVRVGGAPWEAPQNDTILIRVKGNTVQDIPVTPYFTINNASFQKSGNKVVAKFTIKKIVEDAEITSVSLYLGKSILTDNNRNEGNISLDLSNLSLNQEITAEISVPDGLAKADYVFARVGVQSNKANEFCYTQVEKVELK